MGRGPQQSDSHMSRCDEVNKGQQGGIIIMSGKPYNQD